MPEQYITIVGTTLLPILCSSMSGSDNSLSALSNFPRYGGDSEMNEEDFNFQTSDGFNGLPVYWKGIVSLFAIPLLLAGLSLLMCPFWFCVRCGRCCCCKKTPPIQPITRIRLYSLYFLVIACSIVMVILSGFAYQANGDFSNALLYDNHNLFNVTETLMGDTVDKIDQIRDLILELKPEITTAINGVEDILNDTSVLNSGTSELISQLQSISDLWSNYTVVVEHNGTVYEFPCSFCSTIAVTVSGIKDEVTAQVGPIFDGLNKTINGITTALVAQENDIKDQIDLMADQIGTVRDSAADAEDTVIDSQPDVEDGNAKRELAYNILFAIPLLPIILVLFGIILTKSAAFTMSYICLWFSFFLMFGLLAIHLPIAMLLHDGCVFLDAIDSNFTETFPDSETAKIFQACMDNTKLTEVFGLQSYLNFTNQIEFPTLGNITDNFNFAGLVSFEQDADATDTNTFYSVGDRALLLINNMTFISRGAGHYYTRENYSSLNASYYYDPILLPDAYGALVNLTQVLFVEEISIPVFNDTLNKIRANLSSVSLQVDIITNDTAQLSDNVAGAHVLLEPLFETVDDVDNAATCGFIADAYKGFKYVMCQNVLPSLSTIVICMLVVGILSLVSCCFSFKLVRKTEWYRQQSNDGLALNNQIAKSSNPTKPITMSAGYKAANYDYGHI